jgi:hypothetical protein
MFIHMLYVTGFAIMQVNNHLRRELAAGPRMNALCAGLASGPAAGAWWIAWTTAWIPHASCPRGFRGRTPHWSSRKETHMNTFVLAIMAASSLSLIGSSAFAMDHHLAGEAATPTHEECMTLHQELMAGVEHGDMAARDAVMAGLDDETRARADACHAMMGEMHHDGAEAHEAHDDHHGDDMPAAEEAHEDAHEMHEAEQPHE